MKVTSATLAVALIVPVATSLLMTQQMSFAETVKGIDNAETITWTLTTYERFYSKDGQRTWLRKRRSEYAYMAPGFYRNTRYDDEGRVHMVEIQDLATHKTLRLDMQSKRAIFPALGSPSLNQYGPGGPFAWVKETLEREPLELVGQRQVDGITVNVFRVRRDAKHGAKSLDFWLDAKTKQFVGWSGPGPRADFFDPETDPDRDNPAEETFSHGTIAGSITHDIVFNPKLDPKLFSMTPPEGFEIIHESPSPPMTEDDLIEWLRVTARLNGDVFVDTAMGVGNEKHNTVAEKKQADRTETEQVYLDLWRKQFLDNNRRYPIWDFAEENAVPKTFRYLGKGVALGDADRIVCWYKLKTTGNYRAVYGDLSVKDVAPKDLPLPVEE